MEGHETQISIAILMLAGVGLVHLLTRIWQSASDALGGKRRADRDRALTEAASEIRKLMIELREARDARAKSGR